MDQDSVQEVMTVRTGNSLFVLGSSSPRPQASRVGKYKLTDVIIST